MYDTACCGTYAGFTTYCCTFYWRFTHTGSIIVLAVHTAPVLSATTVVVVNEHFVCQYFLTAALSDSLYVFGIYREMSERRNPQATRRTAVFYKKHLLVRLLRRWWTGVDRGSPLFLNNSPSSRVCMCSTEHSALQSHISGYQGMESRLMQSRNIWHTWLSHQGGTLNCYVPGSDQAG